MRKSPIDADRPPAPALARRLPRTVGAAVSAQHQPGRRLRADVHRGPRCRRMHRANRCRSGSAGAQRRGREGLDALPRHRGRRRSTAPASRPREGRENERPAPGRRVPLRQRPRPRAGNRVRLRRQHRGNLRRVPAHRRPVRPAARRWPSARHRRERHAEGSAERRRPGDGLPLCAALFGHLLRRRSAVLMRPAVVLFSGGLDSTTCLAVAREDGFAPHALAVRYGQRHARELDAAERVARMLGAPLKIVALDLRAVGGSALTGDLEVPKDGVGGGIPVTYVPARNTVLLGLALGYAETLDAQDLYIGVNAIDYSGYPDCRPAFVEAFEKLANVATAAAVEGRARYRVHAPLLQLSKAQIIELGTRLGVPYAMTHSCYDPDPQGRACGRCDSCPLRAQGFREAGVPDPTVYSPR